MLRVYFGDLEDSIYDPSTYFDNVYMEEWITSDIAKKIIKDVDKSEVLGPNCIQSPVLGQIPPVTLSGGVKTLLLMLNEPETIYNGSACGDNCAKWMVEVGKEVDVTINFYHMMSFRSVDKFDIEIINNGEIVHTMTELAPYAAKFLSAERERNRREAERIDREGESQA